MGLQTTELTACIDHVISVILKKRDIIYTIFPMSLEVISAFIFTDTICGAIVQILIYIYKAN